MRSWLHRTVLTVLTAVLASFVVPAHADPAEPCGVWERRVYGITTNGGLVEHRYCAIAKREEPRWTGDRVVATTGWADTAAVFWSGQYHPGAFYRVSSAGGLFWSRDLESWRQVAVSSATDWRGFTSFMSTEPGLIYGTDSSGAVHRWFHAGWRDGADTWADNGVVVATLPGSSKLFGRTSDGFVGFNGAHVTAWTEEFVPTQLRVAVPNSVPSQQFVPFDLGKKYPSSAFAVTAAGRLAVLLPIDCGPFKRTWRVDEETGGDYRLVFAGGEGSVGAPVEWQCV